MTPAPLTRSMLLNKHEGPDEIERAEEKFKALMDDLKRQIAVLDPTKREAA